MKKKWLLLMILVIASIECFAKTSSNAATMLWEKPISTVADSVRGPVAMGISTISIVVAGLAWMFTEGGNMMGKMIKIALGAIIVFGVLILLYNLFGAKAGFII